MSSPILPIRPTADVSIAPKVGQSPSDPGGVFRDLLQQSISTVEQNRLDAQNSIDRFLSGEGEEIHQVALATQKAELSFDLFLQVRNKVVQAYQEVLRMQV
jgi:flagellar hook-basal body complex protein FliE